MWFRMAIGTVTNEFGKEHVIVVSAPSVVLTKLEASKGQRDVAMASYLSSDCLFLGLGEKRMATPYNKALDSAMLGAGVQPAEIFRFTKDKIGVAIKFKTAAFAAQIRGTDDKIRISRHHAHGLPPGIRIEIHHQ